LGVDKVGPNAASSLELKSAGSVRWCRLTRHQARIFGPPGSATAIIAALGNLKGCAHITDISSGLAVLVLAGAKAADVLARFVRVDLDAGQFADHQIAMTGAAGVGVHIMRWDRGDLPVFELTVGRDVAEYVWDELLHGGHDLGLKPMGAGWLLQAEAVSK
jgi:heterotetrameric sarcosine oxidase gamma subunit